ncbi:NYN domain-containing protein [Flavitalea flava]
METTPRDPRLAVLIDADNVPYHHIREMLEEIAKYGTPTFKRIYADWTRPTSSGWKTVLLENAISPVQQYSYTSGKNSSDSAMIIDAMDILYTGQVDGFCIVSSDSDFTRLATRLREGGMKVFGLGEKKTPVAFISACNKFIYLEILSKEKTTSGKTAVLPAAPQAPASRRSAGNVAIANAPAKKGNQKTPSPAKRAENDKQENDKQPPSPVQAQAETTRTEETARSEDTIRRMDKETIKLINDSINDLADEDGWAFLGELGNLLLKKKPDFDPRNYGFRKLVPLLKSTGEFDIDERNTGKNNSVLAFARTK